eukprot:12750558-Heterocapsa_arctica.AAC.1
MAVDTPTYMDADGDLRRGVKPESAGGPDDVNMDGQRALTDKAEALKSKYAKSLRARRDLVEAAPAAAPASSSAAAPAPHRETE